MLKPNYWKDTGMGAGEWDTPVGVVAAADMDATLDRLYAGYGDIDGFCSKGCNHKDGVEAWNRTACSRWCNAPDQRQLFSRGMEYVDAEFPLTDKLQGCRMVS